MRYSFTQQRHMPLSLALISSSFAIALSSSISSSSSTLTSAFPNSTRYDTTTIASLASVTTFTKDNYTFIVTPASNGEASPTTISEPNGGDAVFVSSLLIIAIPPSASSGLDSSSTSSSESGANTTSSTSLSFTAPPTIVSLTSQSSILFSNSTTSSITTSSGLQSNSSSSATSSSSFSTNSSISSASQSSSSSSITGSASSTASISQRSSTQSESSITSSASPSSSATIPISTSSSTSSSISGSSSSVNPLNIEPYISTVTTIVSGTTQLIPYLFGGMFTTPVPVPTTAPITSLVATGMIVSSSASALSSKVNNDLIPIILLWTNNPQKSQADAAIQGIKGILPFAEDLLDSLGGDPTPGGSDCTGKKKRDNLGKRLPDPFKIASDVIKAISCVVNTLEKTSSEIEASLDTAVDDVEDDISTLKNLTSDLENGEEGKDDDTSSTNTESQIESSTSSSSSCSKTITTEDYYVQCTSSTISLSSNQISVTQSCTTSTSTITGGECSVTAFTTTSTSSGTQSFATAVATIDDGYIISTNLPPANTSLALFYDDRLISAMNSNSTAPVWPGANTQLTTFSGVIITHSESGTSGVSQTLSMTPTSSLISQSVITSSVGSTFSTVTKSSISVSITMSTSIIITSSQAPTSSSASSPTRCVGNQVESSCVAGGFPSLSPYSGSQPPSCAGADGDPGTPPRINNQAASDAATKYCAQLISAGTVLVAGGVDANPYTVAGVAEGGAQMSLIILYDVDGCPTDKSKSSVDFKAMGQSECVMNMYTAVSTVCAQDSTWSDYNQKFTLEGGTYMNDCAIWTISAGP